MRASKENSEAAFQAVKRLEVAARRVDQSAAHRAWITRDTEFLYEFLKACKARLPKEASYDADVERRRAWNAQTKDMSKKRSVA